MFIENNSSIIYTLLTGCCLGNHYKSVRIKLGFTDAPNLKLESWSINFEFLNKNIPKKTLKIQNIIGLGLWCLTLLAIIFQLYPGGQFY
jgi:hypothetical protein